ncbi:MAG TPA: orotidine-5'-phosphate decarboxylase [Ideonella sp.]|nr:orotidine-5'-phosphate decarboxylase [Ideonella sp.]
MQASHPAVIVALDVASGEQARGLVAALGDSAGFYKIGLQLLTADGPALARELVGAGKQVFLDLKLHEIPNSVASAVAAAGALGATMVTVHASGGSAILRAAVEAARAWPKLQVLALTVVTSLREADLQEVGITATVDEQVLRLAGLADAAGCHGVVASPREAALLRSRLRAGMLIVTPGIQLASEAATDQARVATPAAAVRAGATHIVVGRSVVQAADPRAAMARVCQDVAGAL